MKSSSTPTSVCLPTAAPVAAPIAAPSSGAKKMKPIIMPQPAPPAAPLPVVLRDWWSLILPSPSRSTTTMSSSSIDPSLVSCWSSSATVSAVSTSGYAMATRLLTAGASARRG
jgi:hypothetical protein